MLTHQPAHGGITLHATQELILLGSHASLL